MSKTSEMNRRNFLKVSIGGAVGAGITASSVSMSARDQKTKTQANRSAIREYRTLGRTGFKVSDIGIGASFLVNPQVLDMAFQMGLNYIDTAEHYSRGESERTIGKVLNNHDRKSIFITTKLNLKYGGEPTKKNIKMRFMKCLERMQTDYADCLMIHMCEAGSVKHEPYHEAIKELKKEGRVYFSGLSNHGLEQRIYGHTQDPMEQVLLAAAEDGRFDVALFVYNFLQQEQGKKILAACKKHNMGVTLMKTNPVNVYNRRKAGIDKREAEGKETHPVLKKRMEEYKEYLKRAEDFKHKYGLKSETEIRDAAIKFVLGHPDVHTVCPSMNSFDELEAFAALSGGRLQVKEKGMLSHYESGLGRFYCRHACGQCEPSCPHQVPVNTILRYNHYFEVQGQEKHAMSNYALLPGSKADSCLDCTGVCERACPHNVPIQSLLLNAHDNLILG